MKKTMEFFVQTKDVDFNDVIRPTAILDLFQDAAGVHAKDLGVGYEAMLQKNYAWVVLYQKFSILNIPPYLDYVLLNTWPKPKSRLEFLREYQMTTRSGEVLVQGISNWVVIDLKTRGLVRSDSIEFNGEYVDYTNYPDRCKRKLNLDSSLIIDTFEYVVELDDIDHNGHMNNARYLNVLQKYLFTFGCKKYIKDVEIAYIKEAKYKENIRIGHFTIENKEAFIGFIKDEICFECLIGVDTL